MTSIWTGAYWKAVVERILWTFVQALGGALLAVVTAEGFDWETADWRRALIGAAIAAGIATLKGLVANAVTKTGPSTTNAEQVVPPLPQPEH